MKSINLKISNNTGVELPISILGVIQNPNGFNNINKVYEFDMSGETLSSVNFTFRYASVLTPLVTIDVVFNSPTPTLQGYVDKLNTLNVGYFTYSGNIIYMFSDDYIGIIIKI